MVKSSLHIHEPHLTKIIYCCYKESICRKVQFSIKMDQRSKINNVLVFLNLVVNYLQLFHFLFSPHLVKIFKYF